MFVTKILLEKDKTDAFAGMGVFQSRTSSFYFVFIPL